MKRETLTDRYGIVAGDIVKICPSTDLWMRGVRYAVVTKVAIKWLHIYDSMTNTKWKIRWSVVESYERARDILK